MNKPIRICRQETQAVMIDMQTRLLAAMPEQEELIHRTGSFLKGLKLLNIPVTVTQQYSKGLGETESSLMEAGQLKSYFDKISYSCWQDAAIREDWQSRKEIRTFVLFGVETHICLAQTAMDLLAAGYQVAVVCDLARSRHEMDKEYGLRRLEQCGAVLVTAEAVLFELLGAAGSEEFRQISGLVKEL